MHPVVILRLVRLKIELREVRESQSEMLLIY
jgi:hypothetical protein